MELVWESLCKCKSYQELIKSHINENLRNLSLTMYDYYVKHLKNKNFPLCKFTAKRWPSVNQKVIPHHKLNLLTLCSWTSHPPDCEK